MIKCLPPKCKPDAGHIFYRQGMLNPSIILSGYCMLLPDRMGIQISSASDSECTSILMSKSDVLNLFPSDAIPTKNNFNYTSNVHNLRFIKALKS